MSGMAHSGWMDVVHWIGVALAAPAAAVVLLASWRRVGGADTDHTEHQEDR